jgi:CheY-like chemotaxis protein
MARILVVDDDQSIMEIVRYVATKAGHEIMEAVNGREGLARAKTDHPDLIILDVMMPEMDGYTLHNHLLADEATKRIPIIVLTAKGQMRDSFIGSPNIKFYMDKPFEPEDLQDKIRIALQGKR